MSDASNIGNWILAASVVLNFFFLIGKFTGRKESRDIGPQPLRVQGEPEYATKSDCTRQHAQVDASTTAMEGRLTSAINSLRDETRTDIKGVHKRIDVLVGAVNAVVGQLTQFNEDRRNEVSRHG